MRIAIGACVLALIAAPASAVPIASDDFESPFVTADEDYEGDEGDWTSDGSSFQVLDGTQSSVPVGWRFAQQTWNGGHGYHIQQDAGSMRVTPNSGASYEDIFIGIMVGGLTVGNSYDVSFDFQADVGILGRDAHPDDPSPGTQTGHDFTTSASWNFMDVDDRPSGWQDTEDYPGHETGSIWIGDPGDWDGIFHNQSAGFVATDGDMAFVLKFRSFPHPEGLSFRLDNFLVTPEPASLALLGLGSLIVLRRRR